MKFSKADIDVLEKTNEELLDKSINLFNRYDKVDWKRTEPNAEALLIYDKEIRYVHLIIKPKNKYDYLCKCKDLCHHRFIQLISIAQLKILLLEKEFALT